MNRLQAHNQSALRRSLADTKLIRSISVNGGHLIDVERLNWEDYWADCRELAEELELLHDSWTTLIRSRYQPTHYVRFVCAYFTLLKACIDRVTRGDVELQALRKVVGFETFRVFGADGHSVAAVLNTRNPPYLLSKVAQPRAFDDPKFLPLVCPFVGGSEIGRLYCHYRRISIANTNGLQLFVYPAAQSPHQSSGYSLIARLFKSLTPKNDPWVKKRSETLFDCVFAKLFADCDSKELKMLDMACGSARVTTRLCKKASDCYGKSFDLTLVDVARGNKSLAAVFQRSPSVFQKMVFRRGSLFDWAEDHSSNPQSHFDVIMVLRVLDVFSRFHIETLSRHERKMLVHRDRANVGFGDDVLEPSTLIESNMHHRIQHSIKRTRLRRGSMFYQFSCPTISRRCAC